MTGQSAAYRPVHSFSTTDSILFFFCLSFFRSNLFLHRTLRRRLDGSTAGNTLRPRSVPQEPKRRAAAPTADQTYTSPRPGLRFDFNRIDLHRPWRNLFCRRSSFRATPQMHSRGRPSPRSTAIERFPRPSNQRGDALVAQVAECQARRGERGRSVLLLIEVSDVNSRWSFKRSYRSHEPPALFITRPQRAPSSPPPTPRCTFARFYSLSRSPAPPPLPHRTFESMND